MSNTSIEQTDTKPEQSEIIPDFEPRVGQNNHLASSRSIITMTDETVQRVKLLAETFAFSSFNSSRNPLSKGDYFLIMLKGLAVGLDPIIAVDFISVIQGKPVIDGKGLLALILNAKKSGEVEDIIIDSQETHCTVTIKRRGLTPHTETFTLDDARRMKTTSWVNKVKEEIPLAEKDNWKQQPRTMLKWRAVAACARACCADIIGGLYSKEEISDGDIIVMEDGTMQTPDEKPKQLAPSSSRKPNNITPMPNNRAKPSSNGHKPPADTPPPDTTFSIGEDPLSIQPNSTPPTTSELSGEPDPDDPEDIRHAIPIYGEGHWYVTNYKNFVKTLRKFISGEDSMLNHEVSSAGLRMLSIPTWKDFKSGKDALIAIEAKYNATHPQATPAPTPQPTAKPQTAPVPAPQPTPAPVPATTRKPASQPVTPPDWHEEFGSFIWTHFDIDKISKWEVKAGKKLSDYANFVEATRDATAIALANCWDLTVDKATYFSPGGRGQTYIILKTLVGDIRMYGRSSVFKKDVGDDYYARYGVEGWQHGQMYSIGLLKVSWKRNEQGTFIAEKVEVLDEEDDDITSDELLELSAVEM